MALFDSEFLKKLEYLSLVSKRVYRGRILAQRRTHKLGTGVEFADHRDYAPGDDFRYLDWNLYARHDELLLKRFREEEDLHVYLLLDSSRSMAFGSPPKFDYARRMTGALAYIALADLDRVAISAFGETIRSDLALTRGKDRILAVLRFLEQLDAAGANTDLEHVAASFVHRGMRKGLVVVVSDFFDPSGFERGLDILRHNGFEPHLVQVHDEAEAHPAMKGEVELEDDETSSLQTVTITERSLERYERVFAEFLQSVQRYCMHYGLGGTVTSTAVPYDEVLLGMMRTGGLVT